MDYAKDLADGQILAVPTLRTTNLPERIIARRGKTRDNYHGSGGVLIQVGTDRISTHDVVYPQCIPFKGAVLTQTSAEELKAAEQIMPTHYLDLPHPNVMVVGRLARMLPVEAIPRAIITGSLWKAYSQGRRRIYGYDFPDGLVKNQSLPEPIVTWTTKAEVGHDLEINGDDDVIRFLASQMSLTQGEAERLFHEVREKTLALFALGNRRAGLNGAMLCDTKYELGLDGNGKLRLADEVHNHDSSRMVSIGEHAAALAEGRDPKWTDKQYLRNYAESQGFRGDAGQQPPTIPDEMVVGVTRNLLGSFHFMTGRHFQVPKELPTEAAILESLERWAA